MKEILKWGGISLAIFLLLFLVIPVNIYSSALYFIAIVGAGIVTFTMLKFLAAVFLKDYYAAVKNTELTPEKRKAAYDKSTKPEGCMIMIIIIVLFFGIGFLAIVRDTVLEQNELNTYGQITNATVIDGNAFATRRIDLSNLILGFKTVKGDSVFLRHSINASQINNFYKHQSIPIIYSTRYPSILQIIYTQDQMDKYLLMGKKLAN